MLISRSTRRLPAHLWALIALYTCASLIHFTHNAEYLPYYPNMPAWITRETVYLVWLAIASVGAAGVALSLGRWRLPAALVLAAYGAFGLDGLAHYTLALCSEHTWVMNATIWFEAATGAALAGCCLWFAIGLAGMRRARRPAQP